jgi:hypothetical protein
MMDSLAHLALMTKAQLVFAAPDTFLSFPALSPLTYSPDELSFASGNALSAHQLRTFAEFSRVTNSLPLGTIFQPQTDTYLWDKYHEVLTTSVLASNQPSSEQKAAVAAAQAYLHVTTPDGLPTDSPAVVAYKQCQDAWFKAVQDYKEKQLSASASTDPKQQAQWKETDEPALRAKIAEAEANWENKGNKAAVEQAQKAVTDVTAQSPQLVWRDWSSKFIPEVDLQTDPEQNTFALTGFLPNNAIEQKDWPSFTLNAFEIGRLVGQAPKELAGIFGELPSTSEIESISFEYRSVGLERPWLEPKVFSARFWKPTDPSAQLSDGGDPPKGDWPAYITAIVFARNIVLHVRAASGPPAPVQLRALPSITQRVQFVAQPAPGGGAPVLKPVVAAAPTAVRVPPPPSVARPAVMMRAKLATATPTMHAAVALAATAPHTVTRDHRSASPTAAAVVRLNPALLSTLKVAHPIVVSPPPARTPPPQPSPTPPPQPSPTPPPSPEPEQGVSILAFVCKRLPRCPNPDPALTW